MSAMPHWLIFLTAAAAVAGILAFLGGAMAFLFVIWPSIRLQTKFIKAQEKKGVDQMLENL
jgi:hypothetical protein